MPETRKLERQLEDTTRRLERAERELSEQRRERLLDDAVADGRIGQDEREAWAKRYDTAPLLTREVLASTKPDPRRLLHGTPLTAEQDAAERRALARTFGLDETEVA